MNIISHTSKKSESVERLIQALNLPSLHYGNGVDKLSQYKYFQENNIPSVDFTESHAVAQQWLGAEGTIMCRTLRNGHRGHGIQVVQPGEALIESVIYTKYIKHKAEYRVNIFQDELVNVRQKLRRAGTTPNWFIRSFDNGFTTGHPNGPIPQTVIDVALRACKVSESDFIGVDVGWNEERNLAFVLEVNSGPSIEGSSVQDFAQAIGNKYGVNT